MATQPSDLAGKVVLVTGAAKRGGRGIALALARATAASGCSAKSKPGSATLTAW